MGHFLWRFVLNMLPAWGICLGILLLWTALAFPQETLKPAALESPAVHWPLGGISLGLLALYILLTEQGLENWALGLALGIYAIWPRVLRRTDWRLLLMVALMFIDLHLAAQLRPIQRLLTSVHPQGIPLFLLGVSLSQLISNVPAAILLGRLSHHWRLIAYGVNLGGNGLLIGSLANLIALRLAQKPKLIRTFHRYSLPYLGVTVALTTILIYWLQRIP